jgi:hypothetical protein
MIDVQVRAQDRVDRLGRKARGYQVSQEWSVAVIPMRDAPFLLVVAQTGIDDGWTPEVRWSEINLTGAVWTIPGNNRRPRL